MSFSLKCSIYNNVVLLSFLFSETFFSGIPAVTMPYLTAFRKTYIVFKLSSLRILSSFSISVVTCNLQKYSKFEESNKKMLIQLSMTSENSC